MSPLHLILALGFCLALPVWGLDLVVEGKPKATIVVVGTGDAMAAKVLGEWVKKMTAAQLPMAESAPQEGVAIYVGQAAQKAGLKLDDIDSPTHEGLRVVCDGRRILLAGQDATSTVKAACRLLEELG